MAATPLEHDAILRAIAAWPVEEQMTLARSILERITGSQPSDSGEGAVRSTWGALYGVASSGSEPPSDEQVAQWLDEHKMDKYGQ